MKFKTTRKAITDGMPIVMQAGYCSLQKLLTYSQPIAYTSGVYGWNADIYLVDTGTVIVTGYRPFGKTIPGELIDKYEKQAMQYDPQIADYNATVEHNHKLVIAMIRECMKAGEKQ